MCNLYRITSNHEPMRKFGRAMADMANRFNSVVDIYPDRSAPFIGNCAAGRDLA